MPQERALLGRQIKAARALLDWSQEQFADAAGISVATARKLEAGTISPRGSTNGRIRNALEGAGLEFLPPDGVRHRPDDIDVFQGAEGVKAFYDDVYQTIIKAKLGNISLVVPDPNQFFDMMGSYADVHRARMRTIKHFITVRCLVTENPQRLPAPDYCEYRLISKSYVDSVPFYIYNHKCAIRVFCESRPVRIVIIDSNLVADAFLHQFESMWEKAVPINEPPKGGLSLQNGKR